MKNSFRIFCCLFILIGFTISYVHAQDLTGIWRGHFRSNDGLERLTGSSYDDRYKIEVQIAQTHNRFDAITYSYKSTEFYGKAEASGTLNAETKKVLLKEGKLLEVRYASGNVCIMTCFMQYSKLGNDEYLQGTYFSTNVNDSMSNCGKGSIFLHRVAESDFHKEPFLEKKENELLAHKKSNVPVPKQPALAGSVPSGKPAVTTKKTAPAGSAPSGKPAAITKKPVPNTTANKKQTGPPTQSPSVTATHKSTLPSTEPSSHGMRDSAVKITPPVLVAIPDVIKNRSNELLKTITVNHLSIELRIYDDGAIDNDTVSVYYDNRLLISKARLSDQPITVRIPVEPSDHPHQLVMVAENLGDIPPNTSLLVVRDGEKRYEERIISTEQKNIVLNFQYKKIE